MISLKYTILVACFSLYLFSLSACTPAPEANVVGYFLARQGGRLTEVYQGPTGGLTGYVQTNGQPVAGATVLVAERTSRVHSAQTDAVGRYQIDQIPPGRYVPAVVAPGFEEQQLTTELGTPRLVQIDANVVTEAPLLQLQPYHAPPLPTPLTEGVQLTLTASTVVTAAFPTGSIATVHAYQFTYANALVNTVRLYLPQDGLGPYPLLFMIYPTNVDAWQSVSVAYAGQGYALLAISPVAARGLDIDGHAADARAALALAQVGAFDERVADGPVVALGGSFSSAILHRFLRDNVQRLPDRAVVGWVTVGGIADAFAGTADFYQGKITLPVEYEYLIPALGPPNLYPLQFLRYSPVYTASQLPATLIIHTNADTIIPIDQAYALERALRAADVPTEVFYYEDVSHYLQIDEQMTDAGREMFYRVLDFADRHLKP